MATTHQVTHGRRAFTAQVRTAVIVVWPLLTAVLCLLLLASESMRIMSAARAYVTGESLWSKGQKDAIFHILQYARSRDEADYTAFRAAAAVTLGDKKARLTLESDHPDVELAQQGFLEGANSPEDIDGLIMLFQRFHKISFMARAVAKWTEGDAYMEKLMQVGDTMHTLATSDTVDQAAMDALIARVTNINRELTPLTTEFSWLLGEASRTTRTLLLSVMFLAALLLVPIGLILVGKIQASHETTRAEKDTLQREVDIAARIQLALLPNQVQIPRLELSANMMPAAVVGGDYYEMRAATSGCWLAIGDVAGHGLTTGLVTLMTQSALVGITRSRPEAGPKEVICALNDVLYENIRRRMGADEHVTFGLMRYFPDGRVIYAGGHEDFLVLRAGTGKCETLPFRGPWLGCIEDIAPSVTESELVLMPGDLLVLYTDGVVESCNTAREEFGLDRLCRIIEDNAALPVIQIIKKILDASNAWGPVQTDDLTVLAARFVA